MTKKLENHNITSILKTKPIHKQNNQKHQNNPKHEDKIYEDSEEDLIEKCKPAEDNSMQDEKYENNPMENESSSSENYIPTKKIKKKTAKKTNKRTKSPKYKDNKNNKIREDSKEDLIPNSIKDEKCKNNSMENPEGNPWNPMEDSEDNPYNLIGNSEDNPWNQMKYSEDNQWNPMEDEDSSSENSNTIIKNQKIDQRTIEDLINKFQHSPQDKKYMKFQFKVTTNGQILIKYPWTKSKDQILDIIDLLCEIIHYIKKYLPKYKFILLIDKISKLNDEITKYAKKQNGSFDANPVNRHCYKYFKLEPVIPNELDKKEIKDLIDKLNNSERNSEHFQCMGFEFKVTTNKKILIRYIWTNKKDQISNIIDSLNQIINYIKGYLPEHEFILLIDKASKLNDEIIEYTKENKCAFEVNQVNSHYYKYFKLEPVIPNELDKKEIENLIDKLKRSECAQCMGFEFKPTTENNKILIKYTWTRIKDQIPDIINSLNKIINYIKGYLPEHEFILLIDKASKLNDEIIEYTKKQNSAFEVNLVNNNHYNEFKLKPVIPNKPQDSEHEQNMELDNNEGSNHDDNESEINNINAHMPLGNDHGDFLEPLPQENHENHEDEIHKDSKKDLIPNSIKDEKCKNNPMEDSEGNSWNPMEDEDSPSENYIPTVIKKKTAKKTNKRTKSPKYKDNKDSEIYEESSSNKDSERNWMKDENSSSKNHNTIPKNAFKKKAQKAPIIKITQSPKCKDNKNNKIHKDNKEDLFEKHKQVEDNSMQDEKYENNSMKNPEGNPMEDEDSPSENSNTIIKNQKIDQGTIGDFIKKLKDSQQNIKYMNFEFKVTTNGQILIKYLQWPKVRGNNTEDQILNIIDSLNQIINKIKGYSHEHKFILLIDKTTKLNDKITKYAKKQNGAFEVNPVNNHYYKRFKLEPVISNELDEKEIKKLIKELEATRHGQYGKFVFQATKTNKKIFIKYLWTNKQDQISNIIDPLNQIINNIKEQFSEYEFILLIDEKNKLNDKIIQYAQKQNSAFKVNEIDWRHYKNFDPEPVISNELDREKIEILIEELKARRDGQYEKFVFQIKDGNILIKYTWTGMKDQIPDTINLLDKIISNIKEYFSKHEFILLIHKAIKLNDEIIRFAKEKKCAFEVNEVSRYYYEEFKLEPVIPNESDKGKIEILIKELETTRHGQYGKFEFKITTEHSEILIKYLWTNNEDEIPNTIDLLGKIINNIKEYFPKHKFILLINKESKTNNKIIQYTKGNKYVFEINEASRRYYKNFALKPVIPNEPQDSEHEQHIELDDALYLIQKTKTENLITK